MTPDHKFFRYLLILLLAVVGLNALVAGFLFMAEPQGSYLGMNTDWLSGSPFTNFFLPGLLLFSIVGVCCFVTSLGLTKWIDPAFMEKLNIYRDRHWAWTFAIYSGVNTIGWIGFQLLLTRYFWLQPVILLLGLAILICSLMPGVMNYYKR